jgi:hypothetical protein
MPTTYRGLQNKLNIFRLWCARNFLLLNRIKTVIAMWNMKQSYVPQSFYWGPDELQVRTKETYVGVTTRTDTHHMFQDVYKEKASKARYCANRIFGLEEITGTLTPKELRRLYMARVDPHLIYACEISPDANSSLLKELTDVQVSFMRHMLGLPERSMLAPLYTETGIMPLQIRRLILTLSFVQYILSLKPTHYAAVAFRDSCELALTGKTSWAKDLQKALTKLPFSCVQFNFINPTEAEVTVMIKLIEKETDRWLQSQVDKSVKLYLLQDRKEPKRINHQCRRLYFYDIIYLW